MRLRTILLFSIGLNLVLGIGWAIYYRNNSIYSGRPILRNAAAGAERPQRKLSESSAPPRRFEWRKIESEDYAVYIQNLRSIGCPERTIRDIIVADVNHHFAEHPADGITTNEATWWKPDWEGSRNVLADKQKARSEQEKQQLLRELLGPGWDDSESQSDVRVTSGVNLEGPVLGDLSQTNKAAVHEIAARGRAKIESYLQTQRFRGQPTDSVELAQMRQQMRAELAQQLNPAQLEEFLLRHSETAATMRSELRGLDLTPDEFRTLFRFRDPLETELAMLGPTSDPGNEGRARVIRAQIDSAVRLVLGPERYNEYQINQDPHARGARSQVAQLGLSPQDASSLLAISEESFQEKQRIRNDPTLTPDQRIDALATTEAEEQKALFQLLGAEDFQRWQQIRASP